MLTASPVVSASPLQRLSHSQYRGWKRWVHGIQKASQKMCSQLLEVSWALHTKGAHREVRPYEFSQWTLRRSIHLECHNQERVTGRFNSDIDQ